MSTRVLTFTASLVPRRRLTRLLAVGGFLIAVASVSAVIWAVGIAGRAETLSRDLKTAAVSSRDLIGGDNSDDVAELREELAAMEQLARDLESDLWPLRKAGAVVGWIPFLGDNVEAAPNLSSRLLHDIEASLSLTEAAGKLLAIYDDIPQNSDGITGALESIPDQQQISEVRLIVVTASLAIARAELEGEKMKYGRLWGRVGSEATELRRQETELRELIDWTLLATDSLSAMAELADVSDGLTAVLETGDTSSFNRDTLDKMSELETSAQFAFETVSAAVTSAPEVVADSPIGSNLRDLRPILGAVHASSRSGALVTAVISPAIDQIKSSNAGLFGQDSGLLASVEIVSVGAGQLQEAEELLGAARVLLSDSIPQITAPWAASAATSLLDLTGDLELAVGLLRELPDMAPDVFGANGERNYLLLAESADEIRASGGFISGAWILTFEDGALTRSEYRDVVDVDDWANLSDYPAPPELLANHMDAPVWLLRDVSWEPEFPSVAKSAAEILAIGQDDLQVDGVVAITQWAMLDMVEALGSIDTDDGPVPSNTLLKTLETGTDGEGREFMDLLFSGLLEKLSGPAINGRMFQLASAASKSLAEKQILVHLFDQNLQSAVSRAGWDGVVPTGPGDRIAIYDSNVGWSKVDRNIQRSFDYRVELGRSEPSTGTLTINYENVSGTDASGCGSQRMDRGFTYEELKHACYWNLLRVYAASGGSLISSTPLPLPDNSVYGALGFAAVGDDTVSLGIGPGGGFVTGLLVVPPGESAETSFVLQLPDNVVNWSGNLSTYNLHLAAQPGARGRTANVVVVMPPGYEYAGSSLPPDHVDGEEVFFDIPLRQDTLLTVMMQRPSTVSRPQIDAVGPVIAVTSR
jgi:hypothetical protein